MPPPVYGQLCTRDEGGVIGGKKGDRLGHFVHVTRSTQSMRLFASFQELYQHKWKYFI